MTTGEPPPPAAFAFLQGLAGRFERMVGAQDARRQGRWMLFVVLLAAGLSLTCKWPVYTDPYAKFPGNFRAFPGTPYGQAVIWWLEHPFQPVPVDQFFPPETRGDPVINGSASHLDKLTFRGLLPLLNGVTHGGYWTLVVANHVAMLAIFLLLYVICRRTTGDAALATALVWAFAATWAGTWGFNDQVCGDAVAIALMLAALAWRSPVLVTLVLLAAAFTDERVLFAAPLLALIRLWQVTPPGTPPAGAVAGQAVRPVLLAFAAYLACRWGLAAWLQVATGTSMVGHLEIVLYHVFVSYPAKLFMVFEFLWLFPLGLVAGLLGRGAASHRAALAYVLTMGCAFLPGLLVWDITRSLCYLLPGVLAAVCFFPSDASARRWLLYAVTLASVLWIEFFGSVLRFAV